MVYDRAMSLSVDARSAGVPGGLTPSSRTTIFDGMSGFKRVRRRLIARACRVADTGWFGLTRLRQHVLVCGFPASGTTLLQLMLENGMPHARRFGREVGGWRAATYCWRNHPVVISKVPHDIFRLDPLRNFYDGRAAELRVILTLRDPRDLLTARRTRDALARAGDRANTGRVDYCLAVDQWRRYQQAFARHRDDRDTLVVRYEDLVADTAGQQARVERFVGQPMATRFADFLTVDRPDFDQRTLCGLRPVDRSHVARWAAPEHRDRLAAVLQDAPELPDVLVRLGYEPDDRWAAAYGRP